MHLSPADAVDDTTTTSSTITSAEPAVVLDRSLPAIVIHTALRRELRLAAPLVRDVAAGDTARAASVTHHLDVVLRILHHHHEGEDLHVWPPLLARAAGAPPPIVVLMQDQHAALARHLERVQGSLVRWSADAGVAEREALATALDDLHATLVEHLDLEERAVLPMAERLLSDDDWDAIARHGEQGAQGRDKLLVLGMLAHEGDPAVLARMLAGAPAPIRALLPRLARRRYRRHATSVHGTPNP